ncbi:MAG: phenylalanine--tRNA ligase subunit alpha [Clostridia bacterium]|nr:phenylalanine--tRNA ligase subunit alpha [Clostridia bacterium]
MRDRLEQIKNSAVQELNVAESKEQLEEIRLKYLGKKGELTQVLRMMGGLSAEERPVMGQLANVVRNEIEGLLEEKNKNVAALELAKQLKEEALDVTIPGKKALRGGRHPLAQIKEELSEIFMSMGFSVAEGPDVELDHYNFEALNIPKGHPARDTQDTFYIDEDVVLRTQTSPVQIRVMENKKPPIRIVAPGMVYRSDTADATHSPVFHQMEGLVVDKGITMADLKGTLEEFCRLLYGPETKTRFRPHHFPFTEPSAEVDVSCFVCGGKGCRVCKGEGWIEILGAGMVHPKVLEVCGIDPDEYSGFAFGIGLERVAMRKYDIDDIRLFYENDVKFLKQF